MHQVEAACFEASSLKAADPWCSPTLRNAVKEGCLPCTCHPVAGMQPAQFRCPNCGFHLRHPKTNRISAPGAKPHAGLLAELLWPPAAWLSPAATQMNRGEDSPLYAAECQTLEKRQHSLKNGDAAASYAWPFQFQTSGHSICCVDCPLLRGALGRQVPSLGLRTAGQSAAGLQSLRAQSVTQQGAGSGISNCWQPLQPDDALEFPFAQSCAALLDMRLQVDGARRAGRRMGMRIFRRHLLSEADLERPVPSALPNLATTTMLDSVLDMCVAGCHLHPVWGKRM